MQFSNKMIREVFNNSLFYLATDADAQQAIHFHEDAIKQYLIPSSPWLSPSFVLKFIHITLNNNYNIMLYSTGG